MTSENEPVGATEAEVGAAFARIDRTESTLKAFVGLDRGGALARARALDALPQAERGPLHGLPYGVKEIIDRAGRPTPWGSEALRDRVPTEDAAVVKALDAAGAIAVGETVSTEYAMAAAGPTRNPHDPKLSPGGSSSGSAAAVGAGALPFALATQTIGSIIRPAAYCGAVGYKPRRARIDRRGVMPLCERLDTIGVIARDAPLARLVVEAIGAPLAEAEPVQVVRLTRWWRGPAPEPTIEAALDGVGDRLRAEGVPVETTAAPSILAEEAEATETILAHDMAAHHGDTAAIRKGPISDALRGWLEKGARISADQRAEAVATAEAIAAALLQLIPEGAVILAPATLGPPPPFGEQTGPREPQRLWTLVDWPAVSVPILWRDGLPIAAQLIARPGRDAAALQLAERLHRRKPDEAQDPL